MGSFSRLITGLLAYAFTWLITTPGHAIEIPKPVINIPKPNIPRPNINIPKPNITVNIPKPNIPRPNINVPKPNITVNVPKPGVPKVDAPKPTVAVTTPKIDVLHRHADIPKIDLKPPVPKGDEVHRTVDLPKAVLPSAPKANNNLAKTDPELSTPKAGGVAKLVTGTKETTAPNPKSPFIGLKKSIVLVDQKPVKPAVTGNSEAIKLLASGKTGSPSKNLLENQKKGMQPAGTIICETCPGPNPTSTPPPPALNGGTILAPKPINASSSTPPWEHNGGVLIAPNGASGVLSSNGNGTFNLTANDGSVGTIKFTQVNGNTYGTFSLDGQTAILLVNPNGTTSFVSGIPGGLPGAGLDPSQMVRAPDINLPVLQSTIAGNIANTISSVLGTTTDVPAGSSTLKLDSANSPSNSDSVPVNASQTRTVDTSDTSTTTTSAQAGATGKGDQGLGLSVSDTQTTNVNDPSKDVSVNKVTVNNGDTSATYQQTDNAQGKTSTEQASTKVGDVDVQATNTDSTGTGKTSKTDSLQVGSEGTDVTVSHGSTEGSKNSGSETNAVQASSGDNSVGVSDTKTQGPDKTRKGQVTPGAVTDNTTVSGSANLGGGVGIQGSSSNQQGASAGVTYKTNIDDNTKLTISGQTPLGTPGSPTISGAVTLDKSWGTLGGTVSEGPKGPIATVNVCVGACKPTK